MMTVSGMSMSQQPHDPDDPDPSERLRQIAAILARGVLRLRRVPPTETAPQSGDPGLELPDETVLSVTRG